MTEQEGKTLAERYCSGAEHCCHEVKAMLERHDTGSEDIDHILTHLIKEGFIDESRYACAFVRDKVRFAKWGRIRIAQALRQKRIPHDVAQSALESIDEDDYMAALNDVVRSRYRTARGTTEFERKMKTMRTVCGRGYEPQLVRKVLDLADVPDMMP